MRQGPTERGGSGGEGDRLTGARPATRLQWRAEAAAFAAALWVFRALPHGASLAAGRALGRFAYRVLGSRRRVALANLSGAFPSRFRPDELGRAARASFENLGMLLSDFARLPGLTREGLSKTVEVRGLEHLLQAKGAGRGVLILAAHYGSYELISYALGLLGHPFSFVVRPIDNPRVDRRVRRYREASGNRTIPKQNAVRAVIREIGQGGTVGILIDQYAFPEGNAVFVELLGRKAWTTSSLATIALRTQAPVVPVMIERGPGQVGQVLTIEPAVPLVQTGDRRGDVEASTRRFNEVLERWIARRPEPWLWCHRRWREGDEAAAALAPRDPDAENGSNGSP